MAFANVLIVVYLLIVLALIAVILLQRSEGGALGIGGGSGGGLVSARGSANLLSRTTAILAALFFATAIGLTVLSELDRSTETILQDAASGTEESGSVLDALNALQGDDTSTLPVPDTTTDTPAVDTPAANDTADDTPDLALPTNGDQPASQ